jgi:hypothetical protein
MSWKELARMSHKQPWFKSFMDELRPRHTMLPIHLV